MKFTLSWLRDHLEGEASLEEIVDKLPMIGLEIESVEDRAAALSVFTVASVIEARPHPNADRLSVCLVDTGTERVQVVCGAPNARTGMKGVFAAAGSYIPGTDMVLKAGVIRGEDSNGMLLSEREVGISDEHEGIIELDPEAEVGRPFAEVLGLDDPVIDVAITPNRGDCLGVRGIARDLAAAGLGRLRPLQAEEVPGSYESPLAWRIDLPEAAKDACPYVAGRHFRGVTNRPSPAWMQARLNAIGLRPISALVDITNYVTYDLGRPLHVFDASKVKSDPTMRLAREGEEILALDGETYRLDPEMVVIADEAGPEGIGGVMGGELSGCTAETSEVFLEVALFDPVRVAATGRKLGILSDARYRFERGLDPESARWGVHVAARLIGELCGGETSRVVDAGAIPQARPAIAFRPARVAALGGLDVAESAQRRILGDLGFALAEGRVAETWEVTPPTWRGDVECEACLVEEVLRINGLDAIPEAQLPHDHALPSPAITLTQRRRSIARTALAWRGLDETVNFSFVSERMAGLFGGVAEGLRLANPISSDLDQMRPSVLPSLVGAAQRNADRGQEGTALFEVGPAYLGDGPEAQLMVAAGLRGGPFDARHWAGGGRPVDLFDAKADALAVLGACEAPVENLRVLAEAPAWYHPGRAGTLQLGPMALAHFGEIHPRVLKGAELKGPAVGFEVFLDRLPKPKAAKRGAGKLKAALELSPFQPVSRDFAFLVDGSVPAETLLRAARGAEKALITEVTLFDLYAGEGIPEGKRSIAVAVTLQPRERTMTDAEIEAVAGKIVAAVVKATGGELRG